MGKHLVDIDEAALAAARAELGTDTIKDTVNESLRAAAAARAGQVHAALDVLAGFDLRDRGDAWPPTRDVVEPLATAGRAARAGMVVAPDGDSV